MPEQNPNEKQFLQITDYFRRKIKKSPIKISDIAKEAGYHPSVFSRIISGKENITGIDKRIFEVAKIIGYKGKIFKK